MQRNGHSNIPAPQLDNLQVVNRHTFAGPRDQSYVYVGRGTPLGNKWSHVGNTAAQFRVGSRVEAVDRYREWLWQEIQRGTGPAFATLQELKSRAVNGEKLSLACSCTPQLCHGDVIKGAIEHLVQRDREQSIQQTLSAEHSQTVFVSGSRSIKSLPAQARDHLDRYIAQGAHILVGDAPGVDALIQRYLRNANYSQVTVFHIGEHPRNNIGFKTERVAGSRQTDKDAQMAQRADRGLAIWDGKSPGTKTNISRLETDVVKVSPRVSARADQAHADVLAHNDSDNFRTFYNVPEGLTRGQHTSSLHHTNQFIRDEFERGTTIADNILSIPRDPDSRSQEGTHVRIGTESHAIDFVSGFISDPEAARTKGERLYQLAEKACGQWTDSHGRWEIFTRIYDLVRKDENDKYRTNEEKAEIIDQVLDSVALWAEPLPEPTPEPTVEEFHQYTLDLAEENRTLSAAAASQTQEQIQLDPSSERDARLLYLHELQSNSHGLATIAELTGFGLDGSQSEIALDESQIHSDLVEHSVVDAMDFGAPEGDHLAPERSAGNGAMLDATFERVNLDNLAPPIPDTLSQQTESYLVDSLLPVIDAQIESGLSRQQILSAIYQANNAHQSERFNSQIERAFQLASPSDRQAPSRQDRLNALTSLRLLVAGEYKRETRGFTREAIQWAQGNYRLDPDQLRAAGKLKVGEYAQLVNGQTAARAQWQQEHSGQQVPYRAQIERINQLEGAGHKINNRISALDPSRPEQLAALDRAQACLLSAQRNVDYRLEAFKEAEDRQLQLQHEAREYAAATRTGDRFGAQQSIAAHNEHERAIDEREAIIRANNPRFNYLTSTAAPSGYSDLVGSQRSSALAELKTDHDKERRAERTRLASELVSPEIEAKQLANAAELKDHQHHFTQIAGREVATSVEAHNALQPVLASLTSVITFAESSRQRLDSSAAPPAMGLDLDHAPVYISLTSNEHLRIPVVSLPEYDSLTNAIHDCRLETATWRSLYTPTPITGRDEERDAIATFIGAYVDFRQADHITSELQNNSVFREYSQRISDARSPEELTETVIAISKENFDNHRQLEAHRADPQKTAAPQKTRLTVKEMRQLFLTSTPLAGDKNVRAQMRDILLSTLFGKAKTDRVQLLAKGQLQPSPILAKLLQNLDTRKSLAAVNHFYASLRNPAPSRQNAFNLYEAHRSLPQYERDYLHQHALAAKYESLKAPDRAPVTPELPLNESRVESPATAAKATTSYRSYYGQADLREATLCAEASARQNGVPAASLERSTIAPEFSDLEVRTISYAIHNFDAARQSQISEHLHASDDPHQHALADLLSLAAEVHNAAPNQEITATDLKVPDGYAMSSDSVQAVLNFVQADRQSLNRETAAHLRQTAQQETWKDLQQHSLADPSLLVDAPAKALDEAKQVQTLIQSASQLQERARTAFAVRDSHFNSCCEKAVAALRSSSLQSPDGQLPFISTETVKELVRLSVDSKARDSKGLVQDHQQQFHVIQSALSVSDRDQASQLNAYAAAARDDYLKIFSDLETAQEAVRNSQGELARTLSTVYEQANNEHSSSADRYAAIRDNLERSIIGEHLAQSLPDLQSNDRESSVRELLPAEVLAEAAASAREQAWQSFEPQEIRDATAGQSVDPYSLDLAYAVMDHVDAGRTLEQELINTRDELTAFIDEKVTEQESAVRAELSSATYDRTFQESLAERDPIDGPDTVRELAQGITTTTSLIEQAHAGSLPATLQEAVLSAHNDANVKAQEVKEQSLYASLTDRNDARQQTISELKGPDATRYETLQEQIAAAETQLSAAFQQIDNTLDQLAVTRHEVRAEQQLAQYQQIADPVAERVNEYLKETVKEEGLKSLLEPLRHEEHVERIALTILQIAHEHNVPLGQSQEGIAQVHQIASSLFDTLSDGLERANHHLLEGRELTVEAHRSEIVVSQTDQQDHQHSVPGSNGNGHHHADLAKIDKAPTAPATDRVLDLTRTHDLTRDSAPVPSDLANLTSTDQLAQATRMPNTNPQMNTLPPNQTSPQHDAQELDLVL